MVLLMAGLQTFLLPRLTPPASTAVVAAFFLFISFASRKFSLLDSSRPSLKSERDAISASKRPSWMPPPLVFPIVWTSLGVLRTAAATLVWQATGTLLCPALAIFCAHLAIGDIWNSINNQERRLGVASVAVIFVWGSASLAVWNYSLVAPFAAKLLSPLVVWLTIATALVWDIWRINGGAEVHALYPRKGDVVVR
jgi:tryptophan-rich sensory protein